MSIFGGRDAPEVRAHTRRVVVKFVPALQLPHSEAAEIEHASAHPHAWEALRSKFPGVTLRPLFTTLDVDTLERLEQRVVAAGTSPRLTSYFAIVVPEHADSAEIVQAVAAWPHVELAYVEGGPVPPPVNRGDDTLSGNQKYLSPAPGRDRCAFCLDPIQWQWHRGRQSRTTYAFLAKRAEAATKSCQHHRLIGQFMAPEAN
jgi:hypothetical protein